MSQRYVDLDPAGGLRQALHDVLVRSRVHRRVLLPAEQHASVRRGVPQLPRAARFVRRHAPAVPVVDGPVVGPHHPAVLTRGLAGPLVLVLVVDDRQAAVAVRHVQHALADVQPEDVDLRRDVVRRERQLRRQVVHLAVVTPRVDPEVVRHQALDAVGQGVARQYVAAVAEGVDIARLVAHPAAVLVYVDAEGRGSRTEAPQHRRDGAGRGGCGGGLTARHRPCLALSLDRRGIPLTDLLADLLRGRRLRLRLGREGRGLRLAGRADPSVTHRDDRPLHGHLVELVRSGAVLRQLQIRLGALHGRSLPGMGAAPVCTAPNYDHARRRH